MVAGMHATAVRCVRQVEMGLRSVCCDGMLFHCRASKQGLGAVVCEVAATHSSLCRTRHMSAHPSIVETGFRVIDGVPNGRMLCLGKRWLWVCFGFCRGLEVVGARTATLGHFN